LAILDKIRQGNEYSDNGDCTYGQRYGDNNPSILGYNLLYILSALSVTVILISKKVRNLSAELKIP